MIHEFAVEPEVMATWQYFRELWPALGVENGRLVVEYPGNWRARVYQLADQLCAPVRANAIKSKLGDPALRLARVVGANGRHFDGGDWLGSATRQQDGGQPFRAIFAASNPAGHPDVLQTQEFDPDAERWPSEDFEPWRVDTEKPIRRTAKELAAAALSLLRHCKELVIVDPHFDPREPRYARPFEAFVAAQPRWSRLEIHRALTDPFLRDVQEANFRCLSEAVPEGTVLTVLFWPRQLDGDNMHARYLLTERGGIGYDWGLDEGRNPAETTEVRLLKHRRFLQVRDQYRRDAHYFGTPERVEITGNG